MARREKSCAGGTDVVRRLQLTRWQLSSKWTSHGSPGLNIEEPETWTWGDVDWSTVTDPRQPCWSGPKFEPLETLYHNCAVCSNK